MVSGFLFRRILWPKMTAGGFLLHVYLMKYTIENFFLPTYVNSDSPMFWGCIGPNGKFT